MQMRRTKKTAS